MTARYEIRIQIHSKYFDYILHLQVNSKNEQCQNESVLISDS
jgi:hypothetical protein